MAVIEYTGTITAVNEMVYPVVDGNYFISGMPDAISSVVAYGIKTLFSSTTAPCIDNEYGLTITSETDTFIQVTVTGTIDAGTLRIKHKEGTLGTWSNEYLPAESTLINGATYHFDTTTTYTAGDEFEFHIYPLEVVDYNPLNNQQLYVDMSNGRLYSPGEAYFDRIALSYNSLGTILRVTDTVSPAFVYRVNAETDPLTKGQVVYPYSDTEVKLCVDDGTSKNTVYGIVMDTIYNGSSGRIQVAGEAPFFSGLTVGQVYYVGDNGTINTSTTNLVSVGFAISDDTIHIARGL